MSLEGPFWDAFVAIAARQDVSVNALASRIDQERGTQMGLATAIRLFVLADYQSRLRE